MIEGRPKESLVQYEQPQELDLGQLEPFKKTFGTSSTKKQLPPMDRQPRTEDILNALLPPKEWVESGKHFISHVSHKEATRLDVASLRSLLDQKLSERQAREAGICPVREELFQQCFEEIIRQVTIDEPQRGILLLRVRDEIKMTIQAYQTLYQSSTTFAMRKQLQAEHGKSEQERNIKELEDEKIKLENELTELKKTKEATETRIRERKAIEEKTRREQLEFLHNQEKHLVAFIA
jgi:dynein light intermediate chain, axonemal